MSPILRLHHQVKTHRLYSGLGYESAKKLASMKPAKLIIACRAITKGEEAAKSIREACEGRCNPEVWQLDLADMKQTLSFGQRCLDELDRLDIFVSISLNDQGDIIT